MNTHSSKADFYLVIVTLLASISWMFSKEALAEWPPLLFIGSRFLMAGMILAALGTSRLKHLQKDQWQASLAVGGFFSTAMCFWIMGLFYSHHLGEGAFITSMAVVFVAPLSRLFFRETVSRSVWVALPIAVAGMAMLSLQHGFQLENSQLFFLIAALLLSITFILNGRAASRISAVPLSAIQLSMVGLLGLLLSAFFEHWPDSISQSIVIWISLSVIIGTAARFLLQTYAQGMTSPSRAAIIMLLEPIWTAGIASVWFAERMSWEQVVGCSLIFMALIVNRWQQVRGWLTRAS